MLPPAVDEYLKLLDDESNYPILLHCKAGLHRTGRLTAIYRMEYQGWSPGEALRELRANGYGFVAASEADEFVIQFVQNYMPACAASRAAAGRPAAAASRDAGRGASDDHHPRPHGPVVVLPVLRDRLDQPHQPVHRHRPVHAPRRVREPAGRVRRSIAAYIARYYGFRVPQVFDLLAEPITLMAATFTVAWMQRNNELLPQLSAGIPTRRVIRPVLLGAAIDARRSPR